jgi:hypothetical protein
MLAVMTPGERFASPHIRNAERVELIESILAAWPRLDEGLPEKYHHLARYWNARRALDREDLTESTAQWATEVLGESAPDKHGWPEGATIEEGRAAAREYLETLGARELVRAFSANCCQDYR